MGAAGPASQLAECAATVRRHVSELAEQATKIKRHDALCDLADQFKLLVTWSNAATLTKADGGTAEKPVGSHQASGSGRTRNEAPERLPECRLRCRRGARRSPARRPSAPLRKIEDATRDFPERPAGALQEADEAARRAEARRWLRACRGVRILDGGLGIPA